MNNCVSFIAGTGATTFRTLGPFAPGSRIREIRLVMAGNGVTYGDWVFALGISGTGRCATEAEFAALPQLIPGKGDANKIGASLCIAGTAGTQNVDVAVDYLVGADSFVVVRVVGGSIGPQGSMPCLVSVVVDPPAPVVAFPDLISKETLSKVTPLGSVPVLIEPQQRIERSNLSTVNSPGRLADNVPNRPHIPIEIG